LAVLDLQYGPFDFELEIINKKVEDNKMGNYALGYVRQSTSGFVPKYVGRSDNDLKGELIAKLPTKSSTRQQFKFGYAQTVKEAFDKECTNYHDFKRQLENNIHPRRPDGKNYSCPVRGCTELG
jgi:hypothetical protein